MVEKYTFKIVAEFRGRTIQEVLMKFRNGYADCYTIYNTETGKEVLE